MTSYELTYILRPLEEENLTAANERIVTIVQNAGGEIVARNDWGRRRLAYPIKKLTDAYYTTLFINLPGAAVRGIERSLQLSDDVLRYLVVRVEAHRLPAPPAEVPAAPAAEAPAEPPAEAPAAPAAQVSAAPADQETAVPATAEAPVAAPDAEPVTAAEGS